MMTYCTFERKKKKQLLLHETAKKKKKTFLTTSRCTFTRQQRLFGVKKLDQSWKGTEEIYAIFRKPQDTIREKCGKVLRTFSVPGCV